MIDLFKNKNWHPMLLKEIDKPFNSKDYYFELKFDGERALLFVSGNSVVIKTSIQNFKVLKILLLNQLYLMEK